MVGDVESFGFHLYRLDRSGPWSHKHGTEEAQDVDEAGLTIGDPLAASRGDYEDFLGYWWVDHGKLDSAVRDWRGAPLLGN